MVNAATDGSDQKLIQDVSIFYKTLKENSRKNVNPSEQYILKLIMQVLKGTLIHVREIPLNNPQIKSLSLSLNKLEEKIMRVRAASLPLTTPLFKLDLTDIMEQIQENNYIAELPVKDPILSDLIVFEKAEFGSSYEQFQCSLCYKKGNMFLRPEKRLTYIDSEINSPIFPSSAKTSNEYFHILRNKYRGCIEILPKSKICSLLNDLYIDLPSNSLIMPRNIPIPEQVLVDIPRLTSLKINHQVVYDKKITPELQLDKEILYCKCLEILKENDLNVAIGITKLSTQASLARPCIRIYKGFQFEPLMIYIGAALETYVEILSRDQKGVSLPTIEIKISAIFSLKPMDVEVCDMYIGVMRKFCCDRSFLMNVKAKDESGKGHIEDIYTPIISELKDLLHLDFDALASDLKKAKLFLSESSQSTLYKNPHSHPKSSPQDCNLI